ACLQTLRELWCAAGGGELCCLPAPAPPDPLSTGLRPEWRELLERALGDGGVARAAGRGGVGLAIRVGGSPGPAGRLVGVVRRGARGPFEAILRAGADAISTYLRSEGELNAMAAELADAYDQLVFMYRAAQLGRQDGDLQAVLGELVAEARALLRAETAAL